MLTFPVVQLLSAVRVMLSWCFQTIFLSVATVRKKALDIGESAPGSASTKQESWTTKISDMLEIGPTIQWLVGS